MIQLKMNYAQMSFLRELISKYREEKFKELSKLYKKRFKNFSFEQIAEIKKDFFNSRIGNTSLDMNNANVLMGQINDIEEEFQFAVSHKTTKEKLLRLKNKLERKQK